jgi:photosystem II stability/assembly factor-like uncharacterized protein
VRSAPAFERSEGYARRAAGRLLVAAGSLALLRVRGAPGARAAPWRPAGLAGVAVQQFVVDPSATGTAYAVVPSSGGPRTGLLKTTDGGRTWLALDRGLPARFAPRLLAVAPDDGRVVLAAGADGLYRSSSGGAAWAEVRQPLPPLTALAFDRSDPRVVLAGTELRGNFRSADGGATWRPANDGLPRDRYGTVPGAVQFLQHPHAPRVLVMATNGFAGVYRSADGGSRWEPAGAGLPGTGLLGLAMSPAAPDTLIALTDKGLARSADRGGAWQALAAPPAPEAVAIQFEPDSRSTLYLAGARGTLHRSTNAGGSWVELPALPRPVRALTTWSTPAGPMLAAAAGEGLWQLPMWPTLPASPEPPGPNRLYFPESGHHVAPVFLPFFRAWGGLDRFGLPRTEDFVEDGLVVQYFQRARLEHHPERRGTAYEVQISLLGERLLGAERPPPGEPFESSADQRYFAETGRSVNYAFLRYFQTRGGLDSLGFPISEELLEGGRPVQYFQRARLEYRAEAAGTRDEVQLGNVGDEVLRRRGWLD